MREPTITTEREEMETTALLISNKPLRHPLILSPMSHPPRQTRHGANRPFRLLLLFQHRGSLFIAKDGALELAEIGGLRGRNFDLPHHVFALVVEQVPLH